MLTAKMVERTDGSQWFRIGVDGEKLGVSDFAKLLKEHQSDDFYELISVQKTAFDGFMKHEADVQERDAFECVLLENEGYTKLPKKKCVFHPSKTSLAVFNEKLPAALKVPETLEFDGIATNAGKPPLVLECKHHLTEHDVKKFQSKVQFMTSQKGIFQGVSPLLQVASVTPVPKEVATYCKGQGVELWTRRGLVYVMH
jgi:hypothetical protein